MKAVSVALELQTEEEEEAYVEDLDYPMDPLLVLFDDDELEKHKKEHVTLEGIPLQILKRKSRSKHCGRAVPARRLQTKSVDHRETVQEGREEGTESRRRNRVDPGGAVEEEDPGTDRRIRRRLLLEEDEEAEEPEHEVLREERMENVDSFQRDDNSVSKLVMLIF